MRVLLFALVLNIPASLCFSTGASNSLISRIKTIIIDHAASTAANSPPHRTSDATTIPIEKVLSTPGNDQILAPLLFYASDFIPRREMCVSAYNNFAQARHGDCIDLFDGYESKLIRCQVFNDGTSINVRWKASWIPAGSTWLYNLADAAGWTVTRKTPDSTTIATFSWRSVFGMFQKAAATGNITLPISSVEGNTVVSIVSNNKSKEEVVVDEAAADDNMANRDCCSIVSVRESIDLVSEADKSRLQNRRVAQELAMWIDVSRRPPSGELGITDADEWAGIVQQRILTGVVGAGMLDVDPNEDDSEGVVALLIFGVVTLAVIAISFEYFIVPEIVGGNAMAWQ
ncbi:hypothetical protein ACHAXR_002548 [Thalassiosira sp. AJA248-18]